MLAYTITTLYDPLTDHGTAPFGINNLGEVAGYYAVSGSNPYHGYTYSSGSYTSVNADDPNGFNTFAEDVNDAGEVVGYYQSGSALVGFAGNNQLRAPNAVETVPTGINNTGEVVGSYLDSSGQHHGFLYNGGFTTLDAPNASATYAEKISDNGEVVGTYYSGGQAFGFLYSGGAFTTLGFLPAGINDSEEMVGYDGRGYILYSDGVVTSISIPRGLQITDINNAGTIVGWYISSPGGDRNGFLGVPLELFTSGADLIDFNNLTSTQQLAISGGDDLYNGLGGNDVVTLPNTSNYNVSVGGGKTLGWANSASQPFSTDSRPGDVYTVSGGNGSYFINAGAGTDEITISGGGASHVSAGTGTLVISITGAGSNTVEGNVTGAVSISGGGTLNLSGSLNGSATIGANSILQLGGTATGIVVSKTAFLEVENGGKPK
jgi:probable HAF family extracellular repeat protein